MVEEEEEEEGIKLLMSKNFSFQQEFAGLMNMFNAFVLFFIFYFQGSIKIVYLFSFTVDTRVNLRLHSKNTRSKKRKIDKELKKRKKKKTKHEATPIFPALEVKLK